MLTRHKARTAPALVDAFPFPRLGLSQLLPGRGQVLARAEERRANREGDHHRRRHDRAGCLEPRMPAEELLDLLHLAQFGGMFQWPIIKEPSQVLGQMVALLITPCGIGVQAFSRDALQAPGHVPPGLPQGRGVSTPLDGHRLDLCGAGRIAPALFEQVSAGHHLGKDQPQRVDVRPPINSADQVQRAVPEGN